MNASRQVTEFMSGGDLWTALSRNGNQYNWHDRWGCVTIIFNVWLISFHSSWRHSQHIVAQHSRTSKDSL